MALIFNEPDVPHMRLPFYHVWKVTHDLPGVRIEPTTFGSVPEMLTTALLRP